MICERERERDTSTEGTRDSSHGGMRLDQCPVCHCTVVCELPLYMYGDQHISWSSAIIPTQLLVWGLVFSPAYCFSSCLLSPPASHPFSFFLLYPSSLLNPYDPFSSLLHSSCPSLHSPGQCTAKAGPLPPENRWQFCAFPPLLLLQTPLQERSVCLRREGEMRID